MVRAVAFLRCLPTVPRPSTVNPQKMYAVCVYECRVYVRSMHEVWM